MLENPIEHRQLVDRRASTRGGRRVTDLPGRPFYQPTCPTCREKCTAILAGESDGGWWFVCLSCDYLWDQRQVARDRIQTERLAAEVTARRRASPEPRGASFWRRLAFGRAHGG
jgi:hypothetical protein